MTYVDEDERSAIMDSLFDINIKGRVDPVWRLQRQLERTNIVLGTGDIVTFENSVLALKGDLPISIKNAVLKRSDDYNKTIVEYVFKENCGIKMGTIKNPLVSVHGHPEWEDLQSVPKSFRDKYEDRISIYSPVEVETTRTDYITLFEVMKEEIEKAGVSWQHTDRTGEALKVQKIQVTLPKAVITSIVRNRVALLLEIRKTNPELIIGYRDLNVGWDATPQTPTYVSEE